jgi:NAD(P)-dependent dehydrogenase (short-subunit alcohol dehydrogenase family)
MRSQRRTFCPEHHFSFADCAHSLDGMEILLVGASGKLGSAVNRSLAAHGHRVITASRRGGDFQVDLADSASIADLYVAVGKVDAVVSAAGVTPFKPIRELTAADYTAAYTSKVLGQIELVRQGIDRIAADGSFTLITGILAREPIVTGAAASMAGGAVEAFVRAAAIEIAPQRINAVSPSVFTEALDAYGDYFPGFPAVPLAEVGQAYVRSVETKETGKVYALG